MSKINNMLENVFFWVIIVLFLFFCLYSYFGMPGPITDHISNSHPFSDF